MAAGETLVPVTIGFYTVRMRREDSGCRRISSLFAGYDIPFRVA